MLMDRQTDLRHINLIGGLVICNPPKNKLFVISLPAVLFEHYHWTTKIFGLLVALLVQFVVQILQ